MPARSLAVMLGSIFLSDQIHVHLVQLVEIIIFVCFAFILFFFKCIFKVHTILLPEQHLA
jgi:putative Ca2+/H+ antiporter (TMEM165/GDT1 family)